MAATINRQTATDREIVISRTINGPRRLVFEAYTDVKHLAHWWGPEGFTTTTHAFEFRPGGVWHFSMHGPDGQESQEWIEWQEIVPPERIVYLHGEHAGDPRAFLSTVTLVERGSAVTDITLHAVFNTREQRDEVVVQYGAIERGQETLASLAAYVATLAAQKGKD